MQQIIHQFCTDVRRLLLPLMLYACVLVLYGFTTVHQLELGYVTVAELNAQYPEFPWAHRLPQWLPPIGVLWLGALLFLGDPAHGVRSFWRTRPWDRRAFGVAKASFVLLLIAMPAGSASLVEPLWFREPDKIAILAHVIGNTGEALTLIWLPWLAAGFAANQRMALGLGVIIGLLILFVKKTALILPMIFAAWIIASLPVGNAIDIHWGVLGFGACALILTYAYYTIKDATPAMSFGLGLWTILGFTFFHYWFGVEDGDMHIRQRIKPMVVNRKFNSDTGNYAWSSPKRYAEMAPEPRLELLSAIEQADGKGLTFTFSLPEDGQYRHRDPIDLTAAIQPENRTYRITTHDVTGFYDYGYVNNPAQLRPPPSYTGTGTIRYHTNGSHVGNTFSVGPSMDLETREMQPVWSFDLAGTQRHAGLACWRNEDRGQVQVTVRAWYSPWKAMLDIAHNRNPQPTLVIGAWDTRTKEIHDQLPELAESRGHFYRPENHHHRQGSWARFDFPTTTVESQLQAARIEISRIVRQETIRERFIDKSVIITKAP